ncbi:hypothetical protein GF318_04270 [Candidatus Micrarchaeota archaeon]|nr:hypothetical protein [Candidatus Micrarchaeota archaeon]
MIENYSFGRIVVDGKAYTNDIKIINGAVKPDWWRKEGHHLYLEDMQDVIDAGPDTIIVGCGHDGVLKVDQEVRTYCQEKGIELIEVKTGNAVKKYNEMKERDVAGLFHLTC